MAQLEHIEAIEKRLWGAADMLRANSNYASNEYFLPVMGLIFLRHAYSRFLAVKASIEATLPTRGGKPRALTKEDFSQQGAIFLRPEAQFDYLVSLSDADDRARKVIEAMESIERDYSSLAGVLPKSEYQELDNAVLGQLLRTLNPDELKRVSGDVFGRIYEYFLTQFADQKAHDGGEFFTPVALVSLIAHVLDPERGIVLDPACGSGGMFVQSARVVEQRDANPAERLTFYGLEKNATTIRLAKMNLAVHGLEGDIQRAITYYEDPQELLGKADYVMANPPFNVDEIDADKVSKDPRLPFGLPGANKKGKVSNGNYVWISYFYSYLNTRGRAGFVMSSQASSAGRDEARVRQALIETDAVDVMLAVRANFFYTRTVPCELWFLDRARPPARRDQVLMIDARNIYRKVTRKIYDFSPEQERNLLAIVWLYRGETQKFLDLVGAYCKRSLEETAACYAREDADGKRSSPLHDYCRAIENLITAAPPPAAMAESQAATLAQEAAAGLAALRGEIASFEYLLAGEWAGWSAPQTGAEANALVAEQAELAERSRELVRQVEHLSKLAHRVADAYSAVEAGAGAGSRGLARLRKSADEAQGVAVAQLKLVRYCWRQAHWLVERFPDAMLRDVAGLVKLVDRAELAANDWSLTPGRYVGVAPEDVDEEFDFEETLRGIHVELEDLNAEAVELAATIKRNFEDLGI
jgi:type I restriction enzyme M protein